MQPYRRNQILSSVGSNHRLPWPTSAGEVQEMSGLIQRVHPDQHAVGDRVALGRYRVTADGWAALEALGQSALAKKVS
jgi:hypothetical protein